MKKTYKIILIVLCCLLVTGCSNIKVIRNKQKSKKEVVQLVNDLLIGKYEDLDVELEKVDKAYTVEGDLIRNAKYYYFTITDKDGNKAYATYKDSFKIDKTVIDYTFIETYGAIYNNKELDYYKYLTELYVNKDDIVTNYYASDYEEENYYNKAKVVYELNYKFEDMSFSQYANLLKLGFDIRKYRLENYGTIKHDDPDVFFIFKDSNKSYYVSYYGLVEYGSIRYDKPVVLVNDYTDTYNFKSKINFKLNDEEYKEMLNNFNSIGKHLLDKVHSVNTTSDGKNAYILVNNYTKNNYLLNVLIKFKYDSNSDSYLYNGISLLDGKNIDNFYAVAIKNW